MKTTHDHDESQGKESIDNVRARLLQDLINEPDNDRTLAALRSLMNADDIDHVMEGERRLRRELQLLAQMDQVPVPEVNIPRITPTRIRMYKAAPFVGAAVLALGLFLSGGAFMNRFLQARTIGRDTWSQAFELIHGIPMAVIAIAAIVVLGSIYVVREE